MGFRLLVIVFGIIFGPFLSFSAFAQGKGSPRPTVTVVDGRFMVEYNAHVRELAKTLVWGTVVSGENPLLCDKAGKEVGTRDPIIGDGHCRDYKATGASAHRGSVWRIQMGVFVDLNHGQGQQQLVLERHIQVIRVFQLENTKPVLVLEFDLRGNVLVNLLPNDLLPFVSSQSASAMQAPQNKRVSQAETPVSKNAAEAQSNADLEKAAKDIESAVKSAEERVKNIFGGIFQKK